MNRFAVHFLSVLMLFPVSLPAVEVVGLKIPDSITVRPGEAPLILNGAGIRKKFFVKVYVGALYLPRPETNVEAILKLKGPKSVHMYFLHSEVSAKKLVDAWNDGFEANLTKAEHTALKERIDRFNAMFRTVRKGDVVRLDYQPALGTQVWINQESHGVVEGEDFGRAMLRIWLGDQPADSGLKDAMLRGG